MKIKFVLILLFVIKYSIFYGQLDSCSTSKLIDSLRIEDQKWRNLASKIYKKEIDTLTIEFIHEKINEVDSLNYLLLKQLFYKYGYPGYDKVGKSSSPEFDTKNFNTPLKHQ